MFHLPGFRFRWLVVVVVLAAACSSTSNVPPVSSEPASGGTSPATTATQPTETPTPKVRVPNVLGLTLAKARSLLESRDLSVAVKRRISKTQKPGTVMAQSPKAGRRVDSGTRVTLTVAKKPANPCDPNYAGQCLDPNAYDYDCAGGSGDGPRYVYGTVRVVGFDHYGLDRDGDGIGCE